MQQDYLTVITAIYYSVYIVEINKYIIIVKIFLAFFSKAGMLAGHPYFPCPHSYP